MRDKRYKNAVELRKNQTSWRKGARCLMQMEADLIGPSGSFLRLEISGRRQLTPLFQLSGNGGVLDRNPFYGVTAQRQTQGWVGRIDQCQDGLCQLLGIAGLAMIGDWRFRQTGAWHRQWRCSPRSPKGDVTSDCSSRKSVRKKPDSTTVSLTPSGASSCVRASVKPSTANLVAPYTPKPT